MIRYDPALSSDPYHSHEYAVMEVEPQGEYVSYEDYQLLTSKIAELEAELENTRTQSQWISVADDFPKSYEEVYIWPRPDYGYECFTGIYDKNYRCWIAESHNDHGSERHKVNVTHWANLPLTPKEQGQ